MKPLQLKKALISPLSPTRYVRVSDSVELGFATVGFLIGHPPLPEGEDEIGMSGELLDFQIGHAVPPNASESVDLSAEILDFAFQRHPTAYALESMEVSGEMVDFEFKTHPSQSSNEQVVLGGMLTDFEYSGAPVPEPSQPTYLNQLNKRPLAVLSLEKLISTATVSLRVRRSSDNVEQNIGFVGTALDLDALTAFVGSSEGFAVTVYDQTGNGFDLNFPTSAQQPKIVNGGVYLDKLVFNGTSSWGKITALSTNTPYLDIYTEINIIDTAGNIILESSSNYTGNPGSFAVYNDNSDGGLQVVGQSDTGTAERRNNFPFTPINTMRFFSFFLDRTVSGSGEISAYDSGAQLTPTAKVTNELSGSFHPFDVNVGSREGTGFAQMELRTLVFYSNHSINSRPSIEFALRRDDMWDPSDMSPGFLYDDNSNATLTSNALDQWNDRSGHNYHLTNAAVRPDIEYSLAGRRVVKFNGTSNELPIPAATYSMFANANSGWVFSVYKNATDVSDTERPIFYHSTGVNTARLLLAAGSATGKNRLQASARRLDGDGLQTALSTTERSAAWTMSLALVDYVNRTITTYVNGSVDQTLTGAFTGSGPTSNAMATAGWIGRNPETEARFNGELAAVVGGKELPQTSDVYNLFGYYAHRFGLTELLPVGHPYKLKPPTGNTDPYWNYVVSLLDFTNMPDGNVVTDSTGRSWQVNGDFTIVDGEAVFNGTNAYLRAGSSEDFVFGTGDWTIEFFITTDQTSPAYAGIVNTERVSTTNGEYCIFNAYPPYSLAEMDWFYGGWIGIGYTSRPSNQLIHVAYVRTGTTVRLYVDGDVKSTVTVDPGRELGILTRNILIGYNNANNAYFNGKMKSLRMTKGIGRYTTSFTPPASGGGNTDDFSANTIASYTQYANTPITWTITGGALTCSSGSGTKQSILTRNGVSFADGEISCVITAADDAGLVLRLQNNSNYYVAVICDASGAIGAANQNTVKLFKRVGGTFTQLGTTQAIAFTRGTSHTFSFSAVGNLLTVKFDGSALISTTDSSLAAAGLCGPRSDSFQASFDSFTWP